MIDDLNDVNAFVQRIAKPLRTQERADTSFRAHVMSTIHGMTHTTAPEDAPRLSPSTGIRMPDRKMPSWWSRPYWVRVTPVTALAVAAGVAGVALAVALLQPFALASGRTTQPRTTAAAARVVHDTVHVVRFVLVDSGARSVSLVGEFNQWQKGAIQLRAGSQPGVWTVDVPLREGRHEYAFIVRDAQGERWVADPLAETRLDDFGTASSVISIGASSTS